MAFTWEERRDGVDFYYAADVNKLAEGIIENQSEIEKTKDYAEQLTDNIIERANANAAVIVKYLNGAEIKETQKMSVASTYFEHNGHNHKFTIPTGYDGVSKIFIEYTAPEKETYIEVGVDNLGTWLMTNIPTNGLELSPNTLYDSEFHLQFMDAMFNSKTVTIYTESADPIYIYATVTYYKKSNDLENSLRDNLEQSKAYTDKAIQEAILDSWEVAI